MSRMTSACQGAGVADFFGRYHLLDGVRDRGNPDRRQPMVDLDVAVIAVPYRIR
jgi:hypothetical protein